MTGPVEIAAEAQHRDCPVCGGADQGCFHLEMLRNVTRAVLTALHAAGWRIVCGEVVEGAVDGCPEWLLRITEEWAP